MATGKAAKDDRVRGSFGNPKHMTHRTEAHLIHRKLREALLQWDRRLTSCGCENHGRKRRSREIVGEDFTDRNKS